jgi:hypothetical protein
MIQRKFFEIALSDPILNPSPNGEGECSTGFCLPAWGDYRGANLRFFAQNDKEELAINLPNNYYNKQNSKFWKW